MKQRIESYTREDGVIEPAHEIDVVCAHCKDPVSEQEEGTGVCTNCRQPWTVQQSVNVFATTLPIIGMTIKIG